MPASHHAPGPVAGAGNFFILLRRSAGRQVQRTLKTALAGATVLTVAHRLETVMGAGSILVMENGASAEFGPPDVLLSDPSSRFSALWHGRGH